MDKDNLKIMMYRAQKGRITELNGCITCKLCKGYFIDATTIIECLHTFCRSCIVQYLESNKYCPICDVQVHKTKPLLNIRQDKTIQDLVYKLVPRLYHNEAKRRKTFYEANPAAKPSHSEENIALQYEYILAPDEAINLTLNYYGSPSSPRYLRCPSAVSIAHLKKLIQAKYELTDLHKVDMLYNQDVLNPSLSLMDVAYIYFWKKKEPLALTYKIYECRAKKPKLEHTETSTTDIDRSANNNNWKEVQLRISENGEMSITGIQDASMLELLDATENFKSEIVINESKNMDTYHKPVEADTETHLIDSHLESAESEPEKKTHETRMVTTNNLVVQPKENHVAVKKDLPELKFIGKTVSCNSTLSTASKSVANTRLLNSGIKMVINNAKSGATITKIINTICSDANKAIPTSIPNSSTEGSGSTARTAICSSTVSTSKTLVPRSTRSSAVDSKISRISFTNAVSKTVELSETLNLNSELSVIPLNASASCVSLSSCGTTTVFSTINKTMCSTKSEESYSRNSGLNEGNENKTTIDIEKDVTANKVQIEASIHSKESNNLKRKCEETDKLVEVPAKLPKPTILNHSIGLMNLSNNHPLKKHSKMNRNGERRYPEITEKMPVSSSSLTIGHVLVSQKPTSLDPTLSKPVIINKNVSYLNLNRSNTNKIVTGQKNLGNVPCYMSKTSMNSIGNKVFEKNGEKNEEKVEGPTSNHTTVPKSTITNSHPHSYQNTHHTPIITPSQLPHHQNLNSLQLKQHTSSKDTADKEDTENAKNLQNNSKAVVSLVSQASHDSKSFSGAVSSNQSNAKSSVAAKSTQKSTDSVESASPADVKPQVLNASRANTNHSVNSVTTNSVCTSASSTSLSRSSPIITTSVATGTGSAGIKAKPSTPIGYKTLRDPPKSWNSQINSQIARVNQTVKAQQLANAAAAAASQATGANGQGRYGGDLKSVRPAKFFKGRNMPRYLGNPASGVKPMYQLHVSPEKEKQEQLTQTLKTEKSEIKKHSIVKIDPKTLKPISEKAPETSNLSNISSGLGLSINQSNQELRINPSSGDLKINTSSVSIFNPLKLQQNSPKNDRKSPKSPHSPKIKSSSSTNAAAVTTSTLSNSSSPVNTLSPKQQRDKTSLTFTPPNPFVPNLASPTLNPNQFLFPAGGFPSYDPRFMAAYHSLWYTQRMAAAAAAGLVPPPLPHAFGLNIGLNPTTTIGQQPHSPGVSPKHSTPSKSSGQSSSRSSSITTSQSSKSSPTPANKKSKESPAAKNEKSLETALEKLTQNKVKELGNNKHLSSDNKEGSKDVRNGSPLHIPQKQLNSSSHSPMSENCPLDTQQKKTNGGINTSALEKLSQNKAIEILGNIRDASGKRSPSVHEIDGNSSPATTNGSVSEFSVNQPTTVKNTLSAAHGIHNASPGQTLNVAAKLQTHSKSDKEMEKPEGSETIERFSSSAKQSDIQNDKGQKILDTRMVNVSDDNGRDKSSLLSTETQNRLGQPQNNLENEKKESASTQNSPTGETDIGERIGAKEQTDESVKNGIICSELDKTKSDADEKQIKGESKPVEISRENPDSSSTNVQSDLESSENLSNKPSKCDSAEVNKEPVEACNSTNVAENDASFSDIVSGKMDTAENRTENAENDQLDESAKENENNETSCSVSEKAVLAESDSGGGENTNSV